MRCRGDFFKVYFLYRRVGQELGIVWVSTLVEEEEERTRRRGNQRKSHPSGRTATLAD